MLTKKGHVAVLFFFFLLTLLQHALLNVEADVLYQIPPTMTVLKPFESSKFSESICLEQTHIITPADLGGVFPDSLLVARV